MNDQVWEVHFPREELSCFLFSLAARALGLPSRTIGQGEGLVVHYVKFHLILLFSVRHLASDLTWAWRLSSVCVAPPPAALLPLPSSLQRYLVLPVPEPFWSLAAFLTLSLTGPRPQQALSRKRKLKLKLVTIYFSTLQFIKLLLIFFILFFSGFVPFLFLYSHFSEVSERNRGKCAY